MEKLQGNLRPGRSEDVQTEKPGTNHHRQPTLLTAEVRQSHILQRDLLQETRTLAAGVAGHDLPTPEPVAEPSQSAVAVKRVGQEIAERKQASEGPQEH